MIGVGLTGFGAFLSAWDAGIQLEKGNYESAAAHGVAAGAMAGATFSQLGRSLVLNSIKNTMFTRTLVVLGPWGWAFTAVSIIAAITAEWLKLSPLERWTIKNTCKCNHGFILQAILCNFDVVLIRCK